jgi:hypothetical protein
MAGPVGVEVGALHALMYAIALVGSTLLTNEATRHASFTLLALRFGLPL